VERWSFETSGNKVRNLILVPGLCSGTTLSPVAEHNPATRNKNEKTTG